MTPDETTAALQNAALDLDEAELAVRDDVRAAARRRYCAAADLDACTASRSRGYLARLAADLDAVGDDDAAGVADAAARYVAAVQAASVYGLRRLDEIGLSLADV